MSTPDLDDDSWLDEQLQLALTDLPASCAPDLRRLLRSLVYGPPFQWFVLDVLHEGLRQRLMTAIDGVLHAAQLSSTVVRVDASVPEVPDLEALLVQQAQSHQVIHVLPQPGWLTPQHWAQLNIRRERLAKHARARLLFWLNADSIVLAARSAPDLWAWRAGVYTFTAEPEAVAWFEARKTEDWIQHREQAPENQSLEQKRKRIAAIQAWLATDPPDDMRVDALDEFGRLLYIMGDLDGALQHWRQVQIPFHHGQGDELAVAIVKGRVADILQERGELDEALRIRQEEQLPVYERLGDVREKAVAMGQIASILQVRGQLDEALRIRQEEQLPVYERLGDVREKAVTMGQIADILQAQGQLDEALRIREEDELPIYERLGDAHSKAVTIGQIASILEIRGQLDEALRTLKNELLPAFERMGDMRSTATVLANLAFLYFQQGHHDQALPLLDEAESTFKSMNLPQELAQVQSLRQHILAQSS